MSCYMSASTAAELCKNLFVYDNYHVPFHDAHAQFSVNFPHGLPLGPGMVFPRATQLTFQPVDALGELWVVENGQWVAVQRQELECYPWLTIERAAIPTEHGVIQVEARHVFLDERHLLSDFTFENSSREAAEISPRWLGLVPGDRYINPKNFREFEPIHAPHRPAFAEAVSSGIRAGLAAPDSPSDLPLMAVEWRCLTHPLSPWTGTDPAWSSSESMKETPKGNRPLFFALGRDFLLKLKPGEKVSFRFLLTVAYAWFKRPELDWPAPPATIPAIEAAVETRKAAFLKMTTSPKGILDLRTLRAKGALLRNSVAGLDGEFSTHTACLCAPSASGFSTVFFWDSLFSSVALATFDPPYAQGALHTAFARQLERDGSSPENKFNYTIPQYHFRQSPQAPIASWAVEKYLSHHSDQAFLAGIFPKLAANHRHWEDFGDADRDGLAEWTWRGQAADDSPLYDNIPPHAPGCDWMPPIASVSLNCFLYRDALFLAELSTRLGKTAEATHYRQRAEMIFQKFMEICYVPQEKRFWDYSHRTMAHRKLRTFYLFWPLWAHMPIPEKP